MSTVYVRRFRSDGKPRWIYGLVDPLTRDLRWIGQASSVSQRRFSHEGEARSACGTADDKCQWIRSLLDQGLRPESYAFEKVSRASALRVEDAYIVCALGLGCPLLNKLVPARLETDLSETWQAQIRARIEKFLPL